MFRVRVCVCEGPQHVVVAYNDAFREYVDLDPLGIPAREAFVGFEEYQVLMDDTLRTGRIHEREMMGGIWVSYPWRDVWGRPRGVATAYRLVPSALLPERRVPPVVA